MPSYSLKQASITYQPQFLGVDESIQLYRQFKDEIEWKHREILMFGKKVKEPRLTAWYGDPGVSYQYSGIKLEPIRWTESLSRLKERIESVSGNQFNSVLLNWYRDGKDSMGWHSDDEKELGKNPVIASLSLGTKRDFQIRRKDDHKEKKEFVLETGSLLIMSGEMQHHWQHQIPKRKKVESGRMNLTFRKIL